ncbi:aminotransferase class IV (plasmid) [Streptomyces sp. NBC_00335]|uniref:aminotransferase class IV n=1 Tax=unclassified Streptomyces TaxID=2593676 RepID=UPI00225AA742|nr:MULTISPECIES: aminotransferase class IV [unclassified Streptomyces]MCX5410048.1 aminotransferase class IV [Streptomyces sp. NBC_00086]
MPAEPGRADRLFVLTAYGALREVPAAHAPGPLLAADSWLVADGRVRALDRHRRRFTATCAGTAGVPGPVLDAFWTAMAALLPREAGHWFPRVELDTAPAQASPDTVLPGGHRLLYRLRPAPARTKTARVWGLAVCDPRRTPRHKGPDLGALAEVRSRATAADADEALLVTADGVVLEAANSSLLWWEEDVLCHPPADLPVLPGVTASLLLDRAARTGVRVRPVRRRLSALAGREVWVANALHGLRPVTAWTGGSLPAGAPLRAAAWQSWLDGLGTPLPG